MSIPDFIAFTKRNKSAPHYKSSSDLFDSYRMAQVNLRLVTWGKEHHPVVNPNIGNILQRTYGGYAFPRFRGR